MKTSRKLTALTIVRVIIFLSISNTNVNAFTRSGLDSNNREIVNVAVLVDS